MKGKVVVITGATSGIGQVAAENLAAISARIVQVARDRERGQDALNRLRQRAPDIAHTIYYADLSRLSEMKRVASEISKAEPNIDVLINNAGAMFGSRQLTEDGLERTFALNHMSYFVLTHGLRERLVASAPARVISTASDAHEVAAAPCGSADRLLLRGLRGYGSVAQIRAALPGRCRVASRHRQRAKNCQQKCCASMHNLQRRSCCVMQQILSRAEV